MKATSLGILTDALGHINDYKGLPAGFIDDVADAGRRSPAHSLETPSTIGGGHGDTTMPEEVACEVVGATGLSFGVPDEADRGDEVLRRVNKS